MPDSRLFKILYYLLDRGRATAPELAAALEVSQRTIYRDMERLCRAGIPLRSQRGKNGGISIMEGYAMERTLLTDADRGAILAGLRSLDSVSGTGYYRHLMEKLPQSREAAADDCVVIDLASWYGPALAPRLAELKEACAGHRAVRFTYCAPAGDSRRVVEPDKLVFRWSSWYLHGWCRDREDWRLFKLGRMLSLETLEETFSPRPAPWPITPAEQVYPGRLQAAVRFAPSARWRLVDEYGADSFQVQPDGGLLFERSFPGQEALVRWALSFGDAAEILSPAGARRALADLGKKIWEKYDK